jgi:RNA polymerase sigma-70 factor (ECF subfamily)
VAETRAALDLLARGLTLLPEKLRTPLVLSAIEQLPHLEIAAVLGTSVRAVDSRVFRARQRLAKWWQQQA